MKKSNFVALILGTLALLVLIPLSKGIHDRVEKR